MRYDLTGGILIGASALLYASRFLAAAMFMGCGLRNWDTSLFKAAYGYIGNGLTNWATVGLIAGLLFLAVAVVKDFKTGGKS